jgi:hypothetical protein
MGAVGSVLAVACVAGASLGVSARALYCARRERDALAAIAGHEPPVCGDPEQLGALMRSAWASEDSGDRRLARSELIQRVELARWRVRSEARQLARVPVAAAGAGVLWVLAHGLVAPTAHGAQAALACAALGGAGLLVCQGAARSWRQAVEGQAAAVRRLSAGGAAVLDQARTSR